MKSAPMDLTKADFDQLAIIGIETAAYDARRVAQLSLVVPPAPAVVVTKSHDAAPLPDDREGLLAVAGDTPVTYRFILGPLFDVLKGMKVHLDTRVAALESQLVEAKAEIAELKATPFMKDAGVWRHGSVYAVGDVTTFKGSAWSCIKAHTATGPTADHTCWRLLNRGAR